MPERARNLTAVVVIAAALAVIVTVLATSPDSSNDRVADLTTRLKCPICTSESIADSPSDLSRELTALIEEQVADGWSDDEIIEFFVATYGEEVLLDPPADLRTVLLWLLPVAAAALGIVWIAGRRSRGTPGPITDAEQVRVEEALEERR